MPRLTALMTLLCLSLVLAACQEDVPQPTAERAEKTPKTAELTADQPTAAGVAVEEQKPPAPPIKETFDGEPQLSLFPRAGDYRPEEGDTEKFPFWATFIDHLARTSGPVKDPQDENNRAWSIRSIKTIDAVGFFSPLAVKPATRYRVNARIRAELPEGANAGIGVLEFDEFLWIGDQFPESLMKQHVRGSHEGFRLSGKFDWTPQEFLFTTGPETRMIHLVLFREGTEDRNQPALFDDIEITEAPGE